MNKKNKIWNWLAVYLKPFLSWKFLVSYGMAYLLVTGWSLVFIAVGTYADIDWMLAVGTAYYAFLWTPFAVEKAISIPLAIWFHVKLFGNKGREYTYLLDMHEQAKADWEKLKRYWNRKKDKDKDTKDIENKDIENKDIENKD